MTDYAYLTTTGRRSGRPHTIEIWYGELAGTLYLLAGAGDRSHWVLNLREQPVVLVRLGGPRELSAELDGTVAAVAAFPTGEEEATARRLLAAKYQAWHEGDALSEWARTSRVVSLRPEPAPTRPASG